MEQFFKNRTILSNALPLFVLISYSFIHGVGALFPYGIIVAAVYFLFLSTSMEMNLENKVNRKTTIYALFTVTIAPLFQFAQDQHFVWAILVAWPFLYREIFSLHDLSKNLREKKIYSTLISALIISFFFLRFEMNEYHFMLSLFETALFSVVFVPYFHLINVIEEERLSKFKTKFESSRHEELMDVDFQKEMKFFFHDLMNKTHGLNLFVSEKIRNAGDDQMDMLIIQKELKSLQLLIKDQSNFKHRNLLSEREWISFLEFKPKIQQLSRTYFSHKVVTISENYPKISGDLQQFMVHVPSLERVLENLFKNAFEAKAMTIEIKVELDQDTLLFEIKNDVRAAKEDSFEMAERLGRVIEREFDHEKPIGLESIHYLALRMNGSFNILREQNCFIARLRIPNANTQYQRSLTAKSKRAA